ncbi:MAG TPA: protein-L-isoaspartate(D-aspartate) O-methyltransferase [Gaiellaceae bacterium]|nr:protein-L-isoaspartate(D-aspartate) O-methyltransferase [Gaiellaceae bacterium]
MSDWVDRQLRGRGIADERVLEAMRRVPRELFVPLAERVHAYDDSALPIGYGQTISQPYVVALTCSALRLRGHERVLDVGTGSGYQAAVLAQLAASVVGVERIPELAAAARRNLAAAALDVEVLEGDGSNGVPDRAPFDAIAVAAAAHELPAALVEQLAPEGRMVIPLRDELVLVTPGPEVRTLGPVRFVPLVTGFPDAAEGTDGGA